MKVVPTYTIPKIPNFDTFSTFLEQIEKGEIESDGHVEITIVEKEDN